ncbi:MAG: ACP S-malonyltransferase [Myxococcota bacterium]
MSALALLFPGQGSQVVGMGRDVYEASDAARAVFDTADAILGFPLSRLCFEGPEQELQRTEVQQPAILTVAVALLRALEAQTPVSAAYVAGHSLGEYTALVASGALCFEDAVRLVHARGRFMQEAVPEGRGAMAAVLGAPPELVERACDLTRSSTGKVVTPANYNAPNQTVIAGDAAAVEAACSKALEQGAGRTVALAVSAPFHCPLMEPAAEKLTVELASVRFRDPRPPVVTNVEAEPNGDGARLPELLARQMTAPVRFTDMVTRLVDLGVTRALEVGPGRVLSGLVARNARAVERAALGGWQELAAAASFVAGASAGNGAGR